MADHQAPAAREQQLLEEVEARQINLETNIIARDTFLADSVKPDGGGDAGSALTTCTPHHRAAQMEAGSVKRHLLRISLGLIGGGRWSVKDGYVFACFLFVLLRLDFFWPRTLLACTKYNG